MGGAEAFPVVAETWRACLEDDFELDALCEVLDDLHDGRIELREVWTVTRAVADALAERVRRTLPGWAPACATELLDLVAERRAVLEVAVAAWSAGNGAPEPDLAALVAEWRHGAGPAPVSRRRDVWGLDPPALERLLDALVARGRATVAALVTDDDDLWLSDPSHVERVLRAQRAARRPGRVPQPLALLPDPEAAWPFEDLQRRAGLAAADLHKRLWRLAFGGLATTTGLGELRHAIARDFGPPVPGPARRPSLGGRSLGRPRAQLGTWRRVPAPADTARPGSVDALEADKPRACVVLQRNGVLFRAACASEADGWNWARLQPALRVLELAGECSAGAFFDGVQGLKFALPQALASLDATAATGSTTPGLDPERSVWTHTATDPASCCGLGLPLDLPPRQPTTWLVWHGLEPILIARGRGQHLEVRVPPSHPTLPACLRRLLDLARGAYRVVRTLRIDDDTSAMAAGADYGPLLRTAGLTPDFRSWLAIGPV